jgi:hypothetical protein
LEISVNILLASTLQLLLAATFFIISIVAFLYGDKAQQAAEKALLEQGVTLDRNFLIKHGVKFSESRIELLLPLAIGILLTSLGILNLTGNSLGRTLSLIIEPIVFVIVGLVTSGQVFATQYIKQSFKRSKEAQLHKIKVEPFVNAALKAFPSWLRGLQIVRLLLATVGSLAVIVFLLL